VPAFAQSTAEPTFAVSGKGRRGESALGPSATAIDTRAVRGEAVRSTGLQAPAARWSGVARQGYSFLRDGAAAAGCARVITLRVLAFKLSAVNILGNKQFGQTDNIPAQPCGDEAGESPTLREIARFAGLATTSRQEVLVTLRQARSRTTRSDVKVDVFSDQPEVFATRNNIGTRNRRLRLGAGATRQHLFGPRQFAHGGPIRRRRPPPTSEAVRPH